MNSNLGKITVLKHEEGVFMYKTVFMISVF